MLLQTQAQPKTDETDFLMYAYQFLTFRIYYAVQKQIVYLFNDFIQIGC